MKKVLFGAVILTLLAAVFAFGYVLFGMEDEPISSAKPVSQPQLDVKSQPETDADVLEDLDYEITQNRDTIGWIKIPGTQINNSVLQSHDNTYYLRLDERRRSSVYGCYFADYECSFGDRSELSSNTIIYGHSDLQNNPDGPRFSQLFRFTQEEFARNTPVITFCTPEDWMQWEVFAVSRSDLDPRLIDPNPEGGIAQLAADLKETSVFSYDVPVSDNDRILTLITCTEDTSQRLVVMAKLLESDASIPQTAAISQPDSHSEEA